MLTIRKGGHVDLERLYSAMEIDFDRKELLVFSDGESGIDQGYALVMSRGLYGYVLLKYLGILPWFRQQGLGIEAMRLINKRYADKQGILAELTTFDDEGGAYLRRLRKFFARFGYVLVESDYRIGGSPVELMVKPIKGSEDIAPIAPRMIRDFYSRCLRFSAYERMIDIRPVETSK